MLKLIREHLEPLALAECEDNGKPIYEVSGVVVDVIGVVIIVFIIL